ncbi:MAG: CoA-transferase [Polyangiales bacterium]
MADKQITVDDAVATLKDGMTIGIGGWGSRRKPMAFVRAIARAGLKDLTLISYGGPDVGILCATGQLKKLVFAFVSLDSIPLEPHFRAARQNGTIEVMEVDEGMFQWGLKAAAQRLPFLPTRAGLGSDVLKNAPEIKTIRSPYADGEELVAMPALRMDVAFVHMNRADAQGNGLCLDNDPYFDKWFCMAADRAFMSCEKLVSTEALLEEGQLRQMEINRMMVQGVVHTPGGAHFTECPPDYGRDEAFQKEYAATAKDPALWDAFKQKYLLVDEEAYQKAVKR